MSAGWRNGQTLTPGLACHSLIPDFDSREEPGLVEPCLSASLGCLLFGCLESISAHDIEGRPWPRACAWLAPVSYLSCACLVRGGPMLAQEKAHFLGFHDPQPGMTISVNYSARRSIVRKGVRH